MDPKALKGRTDVFSRRIIAYCAPLLTNMKTNEIADQLLRSGSAVDANYGSAQRGRSNDEFIAKIGQVLDDASEANGWASKLHDSGLVPVTTELKWLVQESDELTRIFATSYQTAKENREKRRAANRKLKRKRKP
jgi:four helix bundle protein